MNAEMAMACRIAPGSSWWLCLKKLINLRMIFFGLKLPGDPPWLGIFLRQFEKSIIISE